MPLTPISEMERHIGQRIRQQRKRWNATQKLLAESLNMTYQQLQKYETGKNRIPASMLYEIAHQLDVPITHFFEGM